MSDSYDDYDARMQLSEIFLENQEARRSFRTEVWITKEGRRLSIRDMGDSHLFNAYKRSQDNLLFREMVLRLFEEKLKERNP